MRPFVEIEYRLRATGPVATAAIDAVVQRAGFVARGAASLDQRDAYVDDDAGSLLRAGCGLRLREVAGERQLTAKTRAERDGLRFVREEWHAEWPRPELPHHAAELPAPLRDLVEPFVLDRPLRAVLHVATRREQRRIGSAGGATAELTIDRVEARANGRAVAFDEVEIEVAGDPGRCERLARRLLAELPLAAAGDDKPTHALAQLGLAGEPDRAGLDPDGPITAVLASILRRQLRALQFAEVAFRQDGGAAHVHAMRIAARQMREFVRTFAESGPEPERQAWVDHLRSTGRRLGAVRDLDVLIADLPARIARLPAELRELGPAALARIADRRARAAADLQAWLREPGRLAAQRQLADGIARTGAGSSDATGRSVVPAVLAAAARRVRKRARRVPEGLPLAPLHELRIACKRLRYLAEEFAPWGGPHFAERVVNLAKAQRRLGAVCDSEAAQRRCLDWSLARDDAAEATTPCAALFGGLATLFATQAKRARRKAEKRIGKLRRRAWGRALQLAELDASS